MNLPRFNH